MRIDIPADVYNTDNEARYIAVYVAGYKDTMTPDRREPIDMNLDREDYPPAYLAGESAAIRAKQLDRARRAARLRGKA